MPLSQETPDTILVIEQRPIAATTHTHANKAELDLITDGDHDVRTDNPHGVTAAQAGAAPTVHSHTASDVTDFDVEVGNHPDVTANTADRHTHANKAVLDAIRQEFLDLGNVSGVTAVDGSQALTIKMTLTGDTTISVTGLATGQMVVLWIDNSGGHTITYTTLIPDDGTAALDNLDNDTYPRVTVQQNDNSETMVSNSGEYRT